MLTRKIIIADANIFIDLAGIEKLGDIFLLPWSIHTTDFILHELKKPSDMQNTIQAAIKENKLIVKTASASEISNLLSFHPECRSLSLADKSIWKYAKDIQGSLLTNDMALRKNASHDGITVYGILSVLDAFIENEITNISECMNALKKLMDRNRRLPMNECRKRLELWSQQTGAHNHSSSREPV